MSAARRAAAVGAIGCLALACGSEADDPSPIPEPPDTSAEPESCPSTLAPDPERSARVVGLLESTDDGPGLLAGATPTLCYGRVEVSGVTPDGTFLLDETDDDRALAARLGHLLHHAAHGLPYPSEPLAPDADCDRVVERALEREAPAYVIEVRVRDGLGLPADRFAFEEEVRALEGAGAERAVLAYLEAHPHGGPGVDGLGAGYRERCETELRAR